MSQILLGLLWILGNEVLADDTEGNRAPAQRAISAEEDDSLTIDSPEGPDDSEPPAEEKNPADSATSLFQMQQELSRMQEEIEQLKRQQRPFGPAKQNGSGPLSLTSSFFEPDEEEDEMDDTVSNSGSAGFQFDDGPPPTFGPDSPYELTQYSDEEPPSELGAVPGQHIRPRKTNNLGSIGFPEMRPYNPDMAHKRRELKAEFAEGLTVRSGDDYFSLTFHNLTQVDGRAFNKAGDPLHDNFTIPRQRWYILGNISPYVRYYTVINRGAGSLDLLDAWTDWAIGDIDRDKLQVRVGRMKTPYTYEYIKIAENDLIAPERSVFVGNLAPNREIGFMAHGQLCEKSFEYAVGLFNGPRRSFQDFNDGKDLFTYVNTKPFLNCCIDGCDTDWLKQLNVGASWNWGIEHQPLQPSILQTANDQSSTTVVSNSSPTFFSFAKNVFEQGERMQWAGDVAYYYKSINFLAGYQGGFQDYSTQTGTLPGTSLDPNAATTFTGVVGTKPTRVAMNGWSFALFYFLTGEEITRRRELLEPKKEYIASKFFEGNIGAIEGFNRVAYIDLGGNVFTAGLADPNVNTARATVLDNGFNWYLSHYTKLTFDWQYSSWATPVFLAPGKVTSFCNLFWIRTQVFF